MDYYNDFVRMVRSNNIEHVIDKYREWHGRECRTPDQLRADAATDKKLVEVYTALRQQDKEQDAKISNLNTRVTAIETSSPLREQIVLGQVNTVAAQATSGIAALQAQICGINKTLSGITSLYVPAASVTPEPMPLKNSWTAPTNPTTGA